MKGIWSKRTALFLTLVFVAALAVSCSSTSGSVDSNPEGKNTGSILERKPLKDPPTYRQLATSLNFYEEQLGIRFFKNAKDRYVPYSASDWKSFSIADDLNECLYDVQMRGLIVYRSMRGKTRGIIEMDVQKGPCGIRYPDADVTAQDKVGLMEGSLVTPAMEEQLNGGLSLNSGAKFLQTVLSLPWKVDSLEGGLEQAVGKVGIEIKNPMDVTFGDVVFFTEYYGERNVGVYVDYGSIIYNSCFRAQLRKMDPSINYRVYRIYTGFNLVRYKLHQNRFMKDFVGQPEL